MRRGSGSINLASNVNRDSGNSAQISRKKTERAESCDGRDCPTARHDQSNGPWLLFVEAPDKKM